jgi:hypothetical protein
MIEIPAHYHQALARLLVVMLFGASAALLLLRSAGPAERRRALVRAAAAGILCSVLSVVLYWSRGAGTGTQTAWGWPRTVFSLWQSWETGERTHGIQWRGLLENAAFFGVLAAAIGGVLARRRASSPRASQP